MGIIKFLFVGLLLNISFLYGQRWKSYNGPYEGIIRTIYEVPKIPKSYLLCGTQNNSLFKYDSSMTRWDRIGDPSWLTDIYCITSNERNHIFLGTRNGLTIALDTLVLVRTEKKDSVYDMVVRTNINKEDNKETITSVETVKQWRQLPPTVIVIPIRYWKVNDEVGLAGKTVFSIAIDRLGNLFAGTNTGLYKSKDTLVAWMAKADHWIKLDSGITNNFINTILIDTNNYIYVGTFGGIFKSTDSGKSWQQISDSTFSNSDIKVLTLGPSGEILAGTFGGGIHKSTNGGNNWVSFNMKNLGSRYISSISVSKNGDIYAGTYQRGIFLFKKNGDTWIDISSNLSNKYIRSILTTSNDDVFIGTVGSGVFRLDNDND